MKRGEIWSITGGVYPRKPRPALIIQDDLFCDTASVTVVPLTTTSTDSPLLRIPIPADALTGLDRPSSVMIDKLTTVRRSNVATRIGRVSTTQLLEIERALLVILGLAR